MKKLNTIWFVLLLAVSGSYLIAEQSATSTPVVLLATAKLVAIFWYFIETEHAHRLWKSIAAGFAFVFCSGMLLLY